MTRHMKPGPAAPRAGPADDKRETPGRTTRAAPDRRAEPHADPLTDDQLERLARLVAVGEAPEPPDLPPAQRERLVAAVRRIRTGRLMDLIARCVALELMRDGGGP